MSEGAYALNHAKMCKICRNRLAWSVDYLRFYEGLSYARIIEKSPKRLKLSLMNLSHHFNRGTSEETRKFWVAAKKLKHKELERAILSYYEQFIADDCRQRAPVKKEDSFEHAFF
jgi:hypothetical protein